MKEKEIIECKLLISKAGALLLARRRRSLRRTGGHLAVEGISTQNAQFLGYSVELQQHGRELSSPFAWQFLWRTARNAYSIPNAIKAYK